MGEGTLLLVTNSFLFSLSLHQENIRLIPKQFPAPAVWLAAADTYFVSAWTEHACAFFGNYRKIPCLQFYFSLLCFAWLYIEGLDAF